MSPYDQSTCRKDGNHKGRAGMTLAADSQRFQFLLEGISRLGGAKALVEVSAALIEGFKPDDMPADNELLFQQVVKAIVRSALDERNAALAILGEQGIDAQAMLTGIEQALGRVDDVDPR